MRLRLTSLLRAACARRAALAFLVAAIAASVFAASAPARTAIDVRNFDVQMSGGPPMEQRSSPSCRDEGSGVMVCTSSFSHSLSGVAMSGTVTARAEGLSGSISTTCDMSMSQSMTMRIANGSVSIVDMSGSGSQSCSWFMQFSEGSSMAGTISGTMQFGKASETTAYFRGQMTVVVVAGTGKFENQVGTGSFDEYNEFPIGGDAGGHGGPPDHQTPPPDGQHPTACFDPSGNPIACPSGSGGSAPGAMASTRTLAAVLSTAERDSKMRLALRKGKPLARIVAPRARLSSSSTAKLRVVSAPGSTCAALARSGARRVDLGQARDANRNGEVAFPGRIAERLGAGAWQLEARCSYSLAGVAGTARDSAAVSVA